MKAYILFLAIVLFSINQISAQQTDENTLAINNYFRNVDDQSTDIQLNQQQNQYNSYVTIVQTGDENEAYINAVQSGDQQVVNQNGNQNSYEYYNYYSQGDSNMIINQEGNQNSLQIYGENSLMKKALINQQSNFQTLIIKNYTH